MNVKNILELLSQTVENQPDQIATIWKSGEHEEAWTYQELWQLIRQFALGLERLGVKPGTKVAILAYNHPYWLVCDLAILSLGAVSIPINPLLSKNQIQFLIDDVDVEMIIIDQAKLIELSNDFSPINQHLILLHGQDDKKNHIISFESVCQLGEETNANWGHNFIRSNDLASIVHTLGTTSTPKGVMLTHGNIIHSIQSLVHAIPLSHYDVCTSLSTLAYLPERVVNCLYAIYQGAIIVFTAQQQSTKEKLQQCKPTFLLSVPKTFTDFYHDIYREFEQATWVKKRLFSWALEVAEERAVYTERGYHWPVPKEIQKKYDRADDRVFGLIREQLGGQLRFMLSFGAPLAEKIRRFFTFINLPIIECYGLTESTSIIACNHPVQIKQGTAGRSLPSTLVKLLTDGELVVQSKSVMLGYYKRPEQTTQALIDGWLHTGDYAQFDEKGHIKIIPRPQRKIYLITGQTIDPTAIEHTICASPFIHQAMIIGNQKEYLTALIIPDFEMLKNYTVDNQFPFKDRDDLLRSQAIQSLIQTEMDQVLSDWPEQDQPQKFVLLRQELTIENGDLTIHGHLRVGEVEKKYRKLIEAMYN